MAVAQVLVGLLPCSLMALLIADSGGTRELLGSGRLEETFA